MPGDAWTPIEVVDRKQIAAKWEQLRIAEPYTIEPDRRLHMAKAFDATLIEGDYRPAQNGIGLELSAVPSGMLNHLIVKLAMTDEKKRISRSRLNLRGQATGYSRQAWAEFQFLVVWTAPIRVLLAVS